MLDLRGRKGIKRDGAEQADTNSRGPSRLRPRDTVRATVARLLDEHPDGIAGMIIEPIMMIGVGMMVADGRRRNR